MSHTLPPGILKKLITPLAIQSFEQQLIQSSTLTSSQSTDAQSDADANAALASAIDTANEVESGSTSTATSENELGQSQGQGVENDLEININLVNKQDSDNVSILKQMSPGHVIITALIALGVTITLAAIVR